MSKLSERTAGHDRLVWRYSDKDGGGEEVEEEKGRMGESWKSRMKKPWGIIVGARLRGPDD